jgi:hypothetical protein
MIFVTADQLVAHAVGDYVLQSDWMAQQKVKSHIPALVHAIFYTLPFLFLSRSWKALLFILVTHFIIDRWRLARYVVYVKNFLAPASTTECVQTPNTAAASSPGGFVNQYVMTKWWHPWAECVGMGYHKDRPAFLAVWLLIIADNVMHVLCNAAALRWLA